MGGWPFASEIKSSISTKRGNFTPHAVNPAPGSADLCFLVADDLDQEAKLLSERRIPVELGPVARTGATSALVSLYVRDPDGSPSSSHSPSNRATDHQVAAPLLWTKSRSQEPLGVRTKKLKGTAIGRKTFNNSSTWRPSSATPTCLRGFDGPSWLHGFHLIVQPSASVSDGSGSCPASTASSAARSQAASCDGSS